MKKYLIFASAALVALAACKKEVEIQSPENNNNDIVVTITSERPQLDASTKTAWDADDSCIIWSDTDKIRVGFTFNGSWWSQSTVADPNADPSVDPKFYASDAVSIDDSDSCIGSFKIPSGSNSFTYPTTSGKYVFYAFYPSSLCSSATVKNPESLSITIKETQSPASNTFDSSADVLLGKSDELTTTLSANDPNTVELTWSRVVAHAALSFSNMNFSGNEIPSKVTLTFNEDAKVTGNASVNIDNGVIGAGSSNVLILDNGFTVNGSSLSVWGCVLPVTFTSLDVEVKTDKAVYTRSISGISKTFIANAKNNLTVNMTNASRTENAPDSYALYSGDLTEGDYIIYYNGNAMKAAVSSNRLQYATVTPVSDAITTNDESIIWHIAASATSGYWTIFNASEGKYAAATGSKNQAQLLVSGTDDKSLWSVSGTSSYDFVNKARAAASTDPNSKFLRNNGTYGFACYASSTGGALSLYKKSAPDGRAEAGMSWSVASADATLTDAGVEFTAPTLDPGQATGITYNSTDTDVATISSTGAVTIVGGGTTTIQAIFDGDSDYKPATAEYTLNVTDNRTPSYDFTTIAELNDLLTTTASEYDGYLTNAVVSFAPADNTAIVTDGTGSVMFYKATNAGGHGLLQGQTFTGAITVTACIYKTTSNNVDYPLYSEVTAWDATFTGSETSVNPESVALADLAGHYSDYQNAYVSVAGLTVVSASTSNNKTTVNVTDGTNSYVVYDNTGATTCDTGDVITAVGTVTKYRDAEQIKVWNSDGITITGTAPKPITFSQPAAGGSFTVKVDGNNITSGTKVAAGKTVTLTATAATDYTFNGWTVGGATVADASAATTTFTMGTSAVTVAASFKQEGGSTGGTMTVNFESATTAYTDWVFSNMTTQQTNSNVSAHGGSYFGTTGGKESATLTTANKIANPASITFYISKTTTNTTASSWNVRVSSNGSTWTNVGDSQSASAGVTRGTWYEVTRDLSSYSDVYVQIQYVGTTAVRTIDDVTLTYN